jgi:hypothetical protein
MMVEIALLVGSAHVDSQVQSQPEQGRRNTSHGHQFTLTPNITGSVLRRCD